MSAKPESRTPNRSDPFISPLLPILLLALGTLGPSNSMDVLLKSPRIVELSVENVGTTVIGHLGEETLFLTQGYVQVDGEKLPSLECRSSRGRLEWKIRGEKPDSYCGEYLQWIEPPDSEPLVLWTYFPNPQGGEGLHNEGGLYRVRDGMQVHRFPKGSNNASFPIENPDGSMDLLYSGQQFVQRIDLENFEPRWEYDDRILFCWGYPTLIPRLMGERTGIVWGSEYNLPDGKSSSAVAIDLEGKEIWKFDGVEEDIGSTPFFPVDVDSDGTLELVKNGLDLCAKNQLPFNHLFIFSCGGELLRKIPSMMYSNGLADLDGDGQVEAFGVVCHRDGGTEARKRSELRCVDLSSGEPEWTVPVPRLGLPAGNALAADLDGDGTLEALVADGNPVFYGHLEGPDWGSLYVVDHKGQLMQTYEFPRWARRMAMCDWDGDGLNELMVQVDGAPACLYLFETDAPGTQVDWPLPFGNTAHWGAEHLVESGPRKD